MSVRSQSARTLEDMRERADSVRVPGSRLGLGTALARLVERARRDRLTDWAADLAYHDIFGLLALLIFVFSILTARHATGSATAELKRTGSVLPPEAQAVLVHQFAGLAKSKTNGLFTASALISIVAALWGLSGAFRAAMSATNAIHEVEETRPVWERYLLSVVFSVATGLLFLLAIGLLVFGDRMAAAAGWSNGLVLAWRLARVPLLVVLVLPALALTYYFAPNVRQPFRLATVGSIVAFVLWLIFSKLFALYVGAFVSYNASFGTLMGIAILVLYLYYSACLLLLGAEIDAVMRSAP